MGVGWQLIPMATHYETLHVTEGAPAAVIRASYRTLSQIHHPDRNPDDDGKVMARINAAYCVLSDPARRANYDMELQLSRQGERQAAGPSTGWTPPRSPRQPKSEPEWRANWGRWRGLVILTVMTLALLYACTKGSRPSEEPHGMSSFQINTPGIA